MRGKDSDKIADVLRSRITPAYAGKSGIRACGRCAKWDHPRLCGEKSTCPRPADNKKGSPPPMRGKEEKQYTVKNGKGITPAYAGKSPTRRCKRRGSRDHPRLCGEKYVTHTKPTMRAGSPPPMRGKGPCKRNQRRNRRITPAYAGKSTSYRSSRCGSAGSPPPMRGKEATVRGMSLT